MKNNYRVVIIASSNVSSFVSKLVKIVPVLVVLMVFIATDGLAQLQTYTTSGTFTAPAGVTNVTVQCWGAGGGGSTTTTVGGGGGGGAYASGTVAVVTGTAYNIVVGSGGTSGVNGGNTTFNTNSIVAAGGLSAANNSATGAAGGTVAASIGTTRYPGGNGANGSGTIAGGGGGGAGSTGIGNNAVASSGGAAKNNNGGAGGAGRTGTRGNGTAGSIYGGGGGGAYGNNQSRNGGAGAAGYATVSWICPVYNLTGIPAVNAVCRGNAASIRLVSSAAGLPIGTYTVTYNLSAPNAGTGLRATFTVTTAGTGTFITRALNRVGTTTVTVTNLSSGSGVAVCGNSISTNNTATVTVITTAPSITRQPASQSACVGTAVSLSVTSAAATSFQWRKNGVDIYGATSATYTIASYTANDAGRYSVTVFNDCGSRTSNNVYITTKAAQPAVTASANASTICAGAAINLSASTTLATTILSENFNALSNNWATTNNSNGGTPANAAWALRPNNYVYSGTTFRSNDNSQFYLSNSAAQGSGSTTATILQTPAFNTQGMSAASLTFYHYYRFNSGTETAKVEVSVNGTAWTTLATYTNTQGAANNFSLVTINLASYLNRQVVFIRFKYDATSDWYWAIDNVNITGTLTAPTYAWSSLPVGFTSAIQNPANVRPSVNTTYTARATNRAGCTNSGSVPVTVNALPAITVQPTAPAATCPGSGTQTISVTASGAGLSYSWRRNGTAVTNGGVISGQGTATLILTNPVAANTGNYDVVISGICAPSVTSNAVAVSLSTSTAITSGALPSSQSVILGGTPANLTVVATGTSVAYQWYESNTNCNNCGTSVGNANGGQTNTYSPPTYTTGTKYYYCIVTGTCGVVTSAVASVDVTNINTWVGGGSSNWNTPTNWLLGVVPGIGSDANIPAGNMPYPELSASATVNNLILNGTATISLGANTLTINGAISGTGSITGSDEAALVIGGNAGTIKFTTGGTNNYLKNFTINDGASVTLGNELNITGGASANNEGTLTVSGTGVLNTGGYLTIKSNTYGTARVAPGNTAGGYIIGEVTVERYIPQNASKAWRLLASNTSGQSINNAWQDGYVGQGNYSATGFGTIITGRASTFGTLANAQANGYDALAPGHSLFKYDPATDNLLPVPNTISTSLASEQGYFIFIRGDRQNGTVDAGASTAPTTGTVLRSKGTLFLGDQSPVATGASGYGLVRNPYPSRIDIRNIVRSGSLIDAFQVWDSKLGGAFGVGGYQTFVKNGADYLVSPGGGSYGANGSIHNFIESGAAFFIQGSAGSTAQVTEACKATSSNTNSFRPTTIAQNLLFNLYAVNPTSTDMVDGGVVLFDDAYSNAVDIEDVRKSPNFRQNFGMVRDNVSLVVEKRRLLSQADTVFFDMSNITQLQYRLDISTVNVDPLITSAVLEDKYTNSSTVLDLTTVNAYTFTADANAASRAADRFRIIFNTAGVVPVNFVSVKAMLVNDKVAVEWETANQLNVAKYEVSKSSDGRNFNTLGTVAARTLATGNETYHWVDGIVESKEAFYRIKAIDRDGDFSYSPVAKIILNGFNAGITALPKMISNGTVNLRFTNQPKGQYNVCVINTNGQVVFKTSIVHNQNELLHKINLSQELVAGIYQLQVVGMGSKSVEKIVISK